MTRLTAYGGRVHIGTKSVWYAWRIGFCGLAPDPESEARIESVQAQVRKRLGLDEIKAENIQLELARRRAVSQAVAARSSKQNDN